MINPFLRKIIHSQLTSECVFIGLQYGIRPSDIFDPEHEVIQEKDRILFDTAATKLYMIRNAGKTPPSTGDNDAPVQPGNPQDQEDPDGYYEIPKPIKVPKGTSVEQHLAGIQNSDPRRREILDGE